LAVHSSGAHYARFDILLEFGTGVREINSINIRGLQVYTEFFIVNFNVIILFWLASATYRRLHLERTLLVDKNDVVCNTMTSRTKREK
jgi:hypothetical protein